MKFQLDDRSETLCVSSGVVAANANAIASVAAIADEYWVVKRVVFSYDIAPVGGAIVISFGGVEKHRFYVSQSGPGEINFGSLCNSTAAHDSGFGHVLNEALEVKLLAGGVGCSGTISIIAI